ncbi:BTAD domain-containing putative transcriptional regulator [Amycolatopsis sp. NPDC054798]
MTVPPPVVPRRAPGKGGEKPLRRPERPAADRLPGAGEAGPRLRINVLGPVECLVGGERVRLGGLVPERVLTALVLEAGHTLRVAQLVSAVWEAEPPATAAHQVRKAVAGLRQLIPGGAEVLVTENSGYRMLLGADQLDCLEFSVLLDRARDAMGSGEPEQAARHWERALALWRGPVPADEAGLPIKASGTALLERHTAAIEQLTDVRLARGEHAELVGELRTHIAGHPLRERLRGQLMLALYRSGRQAEALEVFAEVRALLGEELGLDPGSQLCLLHEQILRNDPALALDVPETAAADGAGSRPSRAGAGSLPNDLPDFVGREHEIGVLRSCLDQGPRQGPCIVAIDGMGGAGKTSLAVRVAYSVAGRYHDAQLYLDLRGFAPDEKPMTAFAAAEALLRMRGYAADQVPDEPAARISLWRAAIAARGVLLLLDNVSDVAQVRPLLPPNPESLVLITSRTRLVDLDGAHWMSLGAMTDEDGSAMAAAVLSTRRAAAEPEAVADLVALCGHLPLAIRIALGRLANRPRWTIGYLVDRMSDESRRLDELRSGQRGVDLTLKISYEGLDARHRAAFRLLGLHPGRDIDVAAASVLLGAPENEAEEILEVLLDAHMLQQHEFGYYSFHDLVRSFVRQVLRDSDPGTAADIRQALERLLDYLVRTSDRVCDLLFAGRLRLGAEAGDGQPDPSPLEDPQLARQWLAREQPTLEAAAVLAHERGFDRHVVHLARNVVFQLDAVGLYTAFLELAELSVRSARRLADPELLRLSLSNLAVAAWKLGRFEAGIDAAAEALEIARDRGDQRGFAKDTGMLGLLTGAAGRFAEALPLLLESIRIKRELGASRAEAESLVNLSSLYEQWARYPEAAEAAARGVALDSALGIHEHQIVARADLASAHLGAEDDEQAEDQLDRARSLVEEFGAAAGDAALVYALSALTALRRGRPEQASEFAERGLRHGRDHWTPIRQVEIDNLIGRLRRAQGRHDAAVVHHERAYRVAAAIGYRVAEARALLGAGLAEIALGRVADGQARCGEGNRIFDELGVPAAARG